MTNTAELITGTDTARGRLAEARGEASDALNLAYELGEVAAAHGWEGVASSMQTARQALEAVVAHLDVADQNAAAAAGVLGEITGEMSSKEVAERLTAALHHFDAVRDAVDPATGSLSPPRWRRTPLPRLAVRVPR